MHETLRSSFKLQKENAEWQRITSDFKYNTFFSIYAKFKYGENDYKPTSCDIKIQNFQGNVTIGLTSIEPEIKEIYDEVLSQYVYLIIINLKALHARPELNGVPIEMKKREKHDFMPEDATILEFSHKNLMYVGIRYEELHSENDLNDNPDIANSLKFIDSARYLRDGDKIKRKKLENVGYDKRLELADDPIIYKETFYDSDGNEVVKEYVDPRPCRDSYVRFF